MLNRWKVLLGIALVVALVSLAGATIVMAQGPTWSPPQNDDGWMASWGGMMGPGWGHGAMMGPRWGYGSMMGSGWGMHGYSLIDAAAEVLGIERADLIAELQAGKSLAELAEERGVEPQAIVDAFLADHEERLQELVDAGRLTQEQADLMLDHMAEEIAERLNEPVLRGPGPHEDCPMFGTGQPTGQSFGWGRRGGRAFAGPAAQSRWSYLGDSTGMGRWGH